MNMIQNYKNEMRRIAESAQEGRELDALEAKQAAEREASPVYYHIGGGAYDSEGNELGWEDDDDVESSPEAKAFISALPEHEFPF